MVERRGNPIRILSLDPITKEPEAVFMSGAICCAYFNFSIKQLWGAIHREELLEGYFWMRASIWEEENSEHLPGIPTENL